MNPTQYYSICSFDTSGARKLCSSGSGPWPQCVVELREAANRGLS